MARVVLDIPWTWPLVQTHMSAPMFRSERMIGSRAVVSDNFDKGLADAYGENLTADIVDMRTSPGSGLLGHKDGYNVLYGDHHVAWYGDPNGNIIWFVPGYNYSGTFTVSTDMYRSLTGCSFDRNLWQNHTYTTGTPPRSWMAAYAPHCSMQVWHWFDTANNIDNAPVDYWTGGNRNLHP